MQEKRTRYLLRELNSYDNLCYEIQNEPWSDNHTLGVIINPYLPYAAAWQNGIEIITAIFFNRSNSKETCVFNNSAALDSAITFRPPVISGAGKTCPDIKDSFSCELPAHDVRLLKITKKP